MSFASICKFNPVIFARFADCLYATSLIPEPHIAADFAPLVPPPIRPGQQTFSKNSRYPNMRFEHMRFEPISLPPVSSPRLLIVEDEPVVALAIEDMAQDIGYTVVALVSRMDTALDLALNLDVDLAILDACINGKKTFPFADILQMREIPFLFSTGYGHTTFPKHYLEASILNKPYGQDALQDALARLFVT